MTAKNQDPARVCDAMKDAGITEPNSQEGIDFCVDQCPYDHCVLYEKGRPKLTSLKHLSVEAQVKMLDADGLTIDEIARQTGVSYRTVIRILVPR